MKKNEMIIDSDSWESCNKLFYEKKKTYGQQHDNLSKDYNGLNT